MICACGRSWPDTAENIVRFSSPLFEHKHTPGLCIYKHVAAELSPIAATISGGIVATVVYLAIVGALQLAREIWP